MLKLIDINKKLGAFALTRVNLSIAEGEYYVLLGRSGAGKTQLLELIAGLEKPDSGSIFLDGADITGKKIQDRKIGIVFQDYAIFPHMTVFGNIAYPLRSRKLSEDDIETKVKDSARQMNISHLLHRSTVKLSGGELQRIALARTLVTSPRLLLLDEPLSSLDASLRDEMKRVLRSLNRGGQTIIHVTHDYSDAVSLAGRVGVIHNGRIIQEGKVDEVFSNPVNRFVARYAGMKNFFRLRIEPEDPGRAFTTDGTEFSVPPAGFHGDCLAVMKNRTIYISKEKPLAGGTNTFSGRVTEVIRSEYGMEITLKADELFYTEITEKEYLSSGIKEGDEAWVSFQPESLIILKSGHHE